VAVPAQNVTELAAMSSPVVVYTAPLTTMRDCAVVVASLSTARQVPAKLALVANCWQRASAPVSPPRFGETAVEVMNSVWLVAVVPPVAFVPPVAIVPPVALVPPVEAVVPPVAWVPPVAEVPPVAATPPVEVAPPVVLVPPVADVPPVTGAPPVPVAPVPPVVAAPPVVDGVPPVALVVLATCVHRRMIVQIFVTYKS
jgi:hypothetical protein